MMKRFAGAMSLTLMALGSFQLPGLTQDLSADVAAMPAAISAEELGSEPIELAQRRPQGQGARVAPHFVGVGGNIGFNDNENAVGDFGFVVVSKYSFTEKLSIRPSVIFSDTTAVLVPVTYNFQGSNFDVGPTTLLPYVGGGVAFTTGDDSDVNGLISAGVDVPISRQFTINGQANLSIFNDSAFGIQLGLGYNFGTGSGRR
ncbi:MAG: hypothetical protein AAFU71_02570 [Cyanobacteria bacterium J06632_22]